MRALSKRSPVWAYFDNVSCAELGYSGSTGTMLKHMIIKLPVHTISASTAGAGSSTEEVAPGQTTMQVYASSAGNKIKLGLKTEHG